MCSCVNKGFARLTAYSLIASGMCKDLSALRSSLWQPGCNGAACFLQVWAQTPRAQTGPNDGREYFVTIQGGRFALGCETFYPVGWNQ